MFHNNFPGHKTFQFLIIQSFNIDDKNECDFVSRLIIKYVNGEFYIYCNIFLKNLVLVTIELFLSHLLVVVFGVKFTNQEDITRRYNRNVL